MNINCTRKWNLVYLSYSDSRFHGPDTRENGNEQATVLEIIKQLDRNVRANYTLWVGESSQASLTSSSVLK